MTEIDSTECMYVGDGIYAIRHGDSIMLRQDGDQEIIIDSEVFQKLTSYAFYVWPDTQRRILTRITG